MTLINTMLSNRIEELEKSLSKIIKMYLHNAYEKDYEAELDDAIKEADQVLNKKWGGSV